MPVVKIPEKNMTIRFPDTMSEREIEDAIYTEVYKQPLLKQAPEPSFLERVKRGVADVFRKEGPRVGPLTEEDYRAFEPAPSSLIPPPRRKPPEVPKEGVPSRRKPLRAARGSFEWQPERDVLLEKKNIRQYASYLPYLAVRAVQGFMGPALPALKALGVDTEGLLNTATEYWRKQVGESLKIPNVGIGRDEKGKLRIEPREPVPFADLLGATSEIGGAVAGPVRGAMTAGGLVAEKLSRYARPFYRSIVKGMVGGALLGEAKKDETLQNMALFGVFEPLAYSIGRASRVPEVIKNSDAWRRMTVKERGLILQSFDEAIRKNPNITEGEILRRWNSASWREEATKFRRESLEKRVRREGAVVRGEEMPPAYKGEIETTPTAAPKPTEAGYYPINQPQDLGRTTQDLLAIPEGGEIALGDSQRTLGDGVQGVWAVFYRAIQEGRKKRDPSACHHAQPT